MGGVLNEYAVGKNGDVFPDGAGQADEGGLEDPLQHALPLGRRRNHGSHERRRSSSIRKAYVPKHVMQHRARAEPGRPRHSGRRRQRPQRRLLQDGHARRGSPASCRTCTTAASGSASRRSTRTWPSEQFNCVNYDFQLADRLQLHRRRCAAPAGGHDHPRDQLARQLRGEPQQPGSAELGRLRQPHHRRHGAALAHVLLHDRRGVQSRSRRA